MTPEQHYEQAELILENLPERGNPYSQEQRKLSLAEAQVHATLATVPLRPGWGLGPDGRDTVYSFPDYTEGGTR